MQSDPMYSAALDISLDDNTIEVHDKPSAKEDPETPLEFHINIKFGKIAIPVLALYDEGASSVFINSSLVQNQLIPIIPIPPRPAYTINGEPIQDGGITHAAHGELIIENHKNKQKFYVADIGRYDVIIGLTWIRQHKPQIEWSMDEADRMVFSSRHCSHHCLPVPMDAYGVDSRAPKKTSCRPPRTSHVPTPSSPRPARTTPSIR